MEKFTGNSTTAPKSFSVFKFINFERFLNAKIFTEIVLRCGSHLTRQNIIAQIKKHKNLQVRLNKNVSFSKTNHLALHSIFLGN